MMVSVWGNELDNFDSYKSHGIQLAPSIQSNRTLDSNGRCQFLSFNRRLLNGEYDLHAADDSSERCIPLPRRISLTPKIQAGLFADANEKVIAA